MEGNNKAMREALDAALVLLEERQKLALCRNGFVQIKTKYCDLKDAIDKCRAALAMPPRQCDVGTPKEQGERFRAFCAYHWHPNNVDAECAGCPLNESARAECEFAWAQMPYEEGENK